jgi:hypothetical protein
VIRPSTVGSGASGRTYAGARRVSADHKERERAIRRRLAAARVRIRASCDEQAAALGLKSHVSIVHRRQGQSPETVLGIEIDRLEREGISTDPILAELLAIQATARASALSDAEITRRIQEALREEHQLEAGENAATFRFAATGCLRTLATGLAPETELQLEIQGLAAAAEERGLEVRVS